MTRQEEINKMAKEVAAYLTYDKDIQVAFADVLKRGAEWADGHPDIDVRTMAAWKSGYQAAIDAHPQWISVEDELPKNRESILFTDGGCVCSGRYYGGRYYGDKGDWVDFCEVSTLIENVTHWMPLPTPPVVSKMERTKQKGGEQ